ncbi:MarR family transcriptional regulator [Methylobacterium radiodurans]|uniref:MarR family transcriptional regulator n=2 Tax=Methylobacterium radiodurans TaxID=2202828 RepID=A0A2U8VYH8_9HYPH|nr:MarR family transcriptional regulator [Methylobacterium radiodurans]
MTLLYDRHLAEIGLRATQFSVLMVLDQAGPLAVNELALFLVLDRTATGRALRPLSRDGLVEIGPGHDGRTRALTLTEAGRVKLEAAYIIWKRAQDEFEAQYGGVTEAEALRLSLARVIGRA